MSANECESPTLSFGKYGMSEVMVRKTKRKVYYYIDM